MATLTDTIGRVLSGRYRIEAAIGTGASAHVYVATDISLKRRVAIKMLHPVLAADRAFLKRFRAEAQAAASLTHPNLVAVHDWGEDVDGPYLVLEYLGGGSLRDLLDDPVPRARTRRELSARRPPTVSHTRMLEASSTATSNPRTFSSTTIASDSASQTSAWRGRSPRPPGPNRSARRSGPPATRLPSRLKDEGWTDGRTFMP